MGLYLLSFFVGTLLLLLMPLLLFFQNGKKKINQYFFVIIAFSAVPRFFHGLETFELITPFIKDTQNILLYCFLIPPIYYLFFETLLLKRVSAKKEVLLIGLSIIIIVISKFFLFERETNRLLFLIYSTSYLLVTLRNIYRYLFFKKNMREFTYYNSIKKWALTMFTLLFLNFTFSNQIFYSELNASGYKVLDSFFSSTSVLWLFIIVYVFMNPIIIYGEQLLLKNKANTTSDAFQIWSEKKIIITEDQDVDIEKKVTPNVYSIILELKIYETQLFDNFKEIPGIRNLAQKLKIPQSHLKYVFKYYCNYSFSEYQNLIRIRYALQLIKSNYLDLHTLESLAMECLFSNRSTFFKNFKKFTGYSPSDYLNLLTQETLTS